MTLGLSLRVAQLEVELPGQGLIIDQGGPPTHGAAKGQAKLRQHIAIRREVRTFCQEIGLKDLPSDIETWRHLCKEMGKFLAAQSFLTHCPPMVMELPPPDIPTPSSR